MWEEKVLFKGILKFGGIISLEIEESKDYMLMFKSSFWNSLADLLRENSQKTSDAELSIRLKRVSRIIKKASTIQELTEKQSKITRKSIGTAGKKIFNTPAEKKAWQTIGQSLLREIQELNQLVESGEQ